MKYRASVWRVVADLEAILRTAEEHLAAGRFAEARASVEEAFVLAPEDGRVRELYGNVWLAQGIRLAGSARERRRREIDQRGRPGEPFEDSEQVRSLFAEVLEAFDRVLAVNPNHAKAWSLKAQVLFRMDRSNRAPALAAYDSAVRALEGSVPEGPSRETGRRNLERDRRRIEAPCKACEDTGFCPECGGSGWRSTLGFRRKCEACLGHGTCKRCGVL